jgi:hypothetical protein
MSFLIRSLSTGSTQDSSNILESLIRYLEQRASSQSGWSGRTSELWTNSDATSAALLSIVLRRWSNDIQCVLIPIQRTSMAYFTRLFASPQHLDRIAKLMLALNMGANAMVDKINSKQLVVSTLCSADFWELGHVRGWSERSLRSLKMNFDCISDAVLRVIDKGTAFLDELTLDKALDDYNRNDNLEMIVVDRVQLDAVDKSFRFLLYAPMEYVTRPIRANLYRRALVADVLIHSQANHSGDGSVLDLVSSVRSFAARMATKQPVCQSVLSQVLKSYDSFIIT